jgi:thiamine transport system ATP-binding protein
VTGLSVREVSVAFGAAVALDRVSLEVEQGATMAVIGPSGSGKSTLLRAIAGLEPLASGEIKAGGRSLAGVAIHQRDLGLMFQDHALFPHLDVAANVGFGLRMKHWPAARRQARVEELLDLVGLAGFDHRPVHELSGGEAQRVALARALAPEPALLMLDEPFGSLDRVLREQLTAEVRRLLSELGQTALHVTHDQAEAFALADRIAVLAEGRVVQMGEPAELWGRPATAFVAEFLGHPNIWTLDVDDLGNLSAHGVPLGRVSGHQHQHQHWHPGSVEVVVPLSALCPRPDGQLVVVTEKSVFYQGRYRLRGRMLGSEPPLMVTFESDMPSAVGSQMALSLTVGDIHRLAPAP